MGWEKGIKRNRTNGRYSVWQAAEGHHLLKRLRNLLSSIFPPVKPKFVIAATSQKVPRGLEGENNRGRMHTSNIISFRSTWEGFLPPSYLRSSIKDAFLLRLTGRNEHLEVDRRLDGVWHKKCLGAPQRGGKCFCTDSVAAFALKLFYHKVPALSFSSLGVWSLHNFLLWVFALVLLHGIKTCTLGCLQFLSCT